MLRLISGIQTLTRLSVGSRVGRSSFPSDPVLNTMKQFLQAILLGVFSDAFKFGTEPVEVPVEVEMEVESLNLSLANTRFDLALALPVVLVNLSNYTGLIMHHNEAVTSDVLG